MTNVAAATSLIFLFSTIIIIRYNIISFNRENTSSPPIHIRVDEWGTGRRRNAVEYKKASFVSYTGGSIHSLNDGGGFNEIISNVWKPIPRETLNTVLYLVTLKILSVLPHARVTTLIIYILKNSYIVCSAGLYIIFLFFSFLILQNNIVYIYNEGCVYIYIYICRVRLQCLPRGIYYFV